MYHEDDAQVPALVGGGVVHVVSLVPRHPVNAHTSWRLSMIRLVFILNNILDFLVRLM